MLLLAAVGRAAGQGAPPAPLQPVPCVACQALSVDAASPAVLPPGLDGLQMLVRVAAGTPAAAWTPALEAIRVRGGRAGLHIVGIPAASDPLLAADAATFVIEPANLDSDRAAFELKQALAAARGAHPRAALRIAAAAAETAALRERGLAPYVDEFVDPPQTITAPDALLIPVASGFHIRRLDAANESAVIRAAVDLQAWFPDGLVALPSRAVTCGARAMPTFLNPRSLDLIAVSNACPAGANIASDMPGAAVERYDVAPAAAFLVRAATGDRFAEGVNVAGARSLTADEIVARHQAAASRQAAAIATDIAAGTFTLTFEAPGFVAPVTVTADTTIFRRRADARAADREEAAAEVRQSNIRVNGVPFDANGGVPRLPIIEPERAAAPPLAITLSDVYRYRLDGRETLQGRETYVVEFEPRDATASLFAGRAWIDAATFGMVRVAAAQTRLKGPVTASEQVDEFQLDPSGRWLLARSDVRQTYEGASIRTPIHRLLVVAQHAVNAADFEARRAEAHASRDVMMRDTPQGFRYLARQQPRAAEGVAALPSRVLAGRAERIRTIAFGIIVDPNISIPLPFAGLSYSDFNLFGTGTQFNGFFGGSYAQAAFSTPSVFGTRWQLGGRAFAIASAYNDRAFERGREQYELDIRQRPAQAAIWTLRPLSSRATLRVEYDWDYNRFDRGDLTAAAFVIPSAQNAHALRLGLDAQRGGWQASVWGSAARRVGWRPWGLPGSEDDSAPRASFQRFGASLLRTQALSPRVTTRLEAAAMGGRNLDRFSRYTFGTFDNRLHGYPSALIRYDRGAVLRTAAAWAVGALRLDGFGDLAAVRDPGFGPGLRRYAGVGSALEAPGPFRTLLSLEWGYGFQGIGENGRIGTHVLRLSGYKVF